MSEVGTRKVFENEDVVLWEFFLEPGEKTPLHTHTRDFASYVIEGSTLKIYDAEGAEYAEFPVSNASVMAFKHRGDHLVVEGEEEVVVPATHMAENIGDTAYKEIFVEIKRSS